MSLEKAIERLKYYYDRAQKLEFVYNKLGWALYQTWKEFE